MNTKKVAVVSAVVLFHVVVATLMIMQPGCKSDGAKSAPESTAAVAPVATPAPVVDNTSPAAPGFVSPTRPPPETPMAPVVVKQPAEPVMAEPVPTTPPPVAPAPTVKYVVKSGDRLATIAKANGVSTDELVAANAPKLSKTTIIHAGDELIIPNHAASATATPATATGAADEHAYKVVAGDSLSKIARKNGTTITALKAVNNMTTDNVIAGQTLKLPAASAAAATTAGTATEATGADAANTYTVVPGDTVGKIAGKFGVRLAALMSANKLSDASAKNIHPGQKLILPAGAKLNSSSTAVSTSATSGGTAPTPTEVTAAPALPPMPTPTLVMGVPATTDSSVPVAPVK